MSKSRKAILPIRGGAFSPLQMEHAVTARHHLSRITEPEVQIEILKLMEDGRVWTNSDLKRHLGKTLPLSNADKARANKRPNEAKWEELINNALSPARRNSLYGKTYVQNEGRGHHRITKIGLEQLEKQRAMDELMAQVLHDMSPEGLD